MAIVRNMTPAERVQQAASLIDAAERVGVYRLRQREPSLSEDEAYRIIRGGLTNYYRQQGRWPQTELDSVTAHSRETPR